MEGEARCEGKQTEDVSTFAELRKVLDVQPRRQHSCALRQQRRAAVAAVAGRGARRQLVGHDPHLWRAGDGHEEVSLRSAAGVSHGGDLHMRGRRQLVGNAPHLWRDQGDTC